MSRRRVWARRRARRSSSASATPNSTAAEAAQRAFLRAMQDKYDAELLFSEKNRLLNTCAPKPCDHPPSPPSLLSYTILVADVWLDLAGVNTVVFVSQQVSNWRRACALISVVGRALLE